MTNIGYRNFKFLCQSQKNTRYLTALQNNAEGPSQFVWPECFGEGEKGLCLYTCGLSSAAAAAGLPWLHKITLNSGPVSQAAIVRAATTIPPPLPYHSYPRTPFPQSIYYI